MKKQKVDCSVLYPYFDSLANDEVTLKHTNIPTHVKQQLKNIYELFEGVLDLTLEEVKTLYFERKMSKSDERTTRLVNRQELKSKVFYNGYELDVTTKLFILKEFYDLGKDSVPDSSNTYCGSCEEIGFNVYLSTSISSLASRFKEAVDKHKLTKSNKTKRVNELVVGDKIILPDVPGIHTVTQIKFIEYGIFQLDNGTGNSIYPSNVEVTVVE
jgi:hypothetical protein